MIRGRGRAPLAIGAFVAIPLFFASLMASALAQEKPRLVQWTSGGHLRTVWHDPAASTEVRVWLWALLPSAILVLIGFLAMRIPLGFYVVCTAAIVEAMAVVHKTDTWQRHHTARFPNGVDLVPATDPSSNKWDPGQWESMARDTALSLQHWTIAIAAVCMVVTAALAFRRRFFSRRPIGTSTPLEGVHAPDATSPGLGKS